MISFLEFLGMALGLAGLFFTGSHNTNRQMVGYACWVVGNAVWVIINIGYGSNAGITLFGAYFIVSCVSLVDRAIILRKNKVVRRSG